MGIGRITTGLVLTIVAVKAFNGAPPGLPEVVLPILIVFILLGWIK